VLIFLYGPPASGKSTIGKIVSQNLSLPFIDLDETIQKKSGMSIPDIFKNEGEQGFRQREYVELMVALQLKRGVVALGGGTLLDHESRANVEKIGHVCLLTAAVDTLAERLNREGHRRPLLSEREDDFKPGSDLIKKRLVELLDRRASHYRSFPFVIDTSNGTPDELAWEIQIQLGIFHVRGMAYKASNPTESGYDVLAMNGSLNSVGEHLSHHDLRNPVAVVTDTVVAPVYEERVRISLAESGYAVHTIAMPAGEQYKSTETILSLWEKFIKSGVERQSTVLALGGGVVSDLAGFAAATFLRGVNWVVLPTTLLAMVDASIGGKTGVNLPQGKNLVGAFYPPRLVLADTSTLNTLPEPELKAGMAEVIKTAIVGDPRLFILCRQGWSVISKKWEEIVRRSMAVKIRIIQEDPYEVGLRAVLNLGHTIGHAVEIVSGYRLRHGEAVAIGIVLESALADNMGFTDQGFSQSVKQMISSLGLPDQIPVSMDKHAILSAIQLDKKRQDGRIRFALPTGIGHVQPGIEVKAGEILEILESPRYS
jgi:3-dehydroquinate synthase